MTTSDVPAKQTRTGLRGMGQRLEHERLPFRNAETAGKEEIVFGWSTVELFGVRRRMIERRGVDVANLSRCATFFEFANTAFACGISLRSAC